MKPGSSKAIQKRAKTWMTAVLILLAVPSFGQNAPSRNAPKVAHKQRVVLVSIPDRKLAVLEDGNVLASFPVAVGAAVSPSPTGEFVIVNRVANPAYYHDGVVMAAGQDNPVGPRWLGLNLKGYGVHGTNAPKSVGHATSHGCIRLRNRDVEKLYTMLRVGDVVEIHGERNDEIAQVFGGEVQDSTVAAAASTQSSG